VKGHFPSVHSKARNNIGPLEWHHGPWPIHSAFQFGIRLFPQQNWDHPPIHGWEGGHFWGKWFENGENGIPPSQPFLVWSKTPKKHTSIHSFFSQSIHSWPFQKQTQKCILDGFTPISVGKIMRKWRGWHFWGAIWTMATKWILNGFDVDFGWYQTENMNLGSRVLLNLETWKC